MALWIIERLAAIIDAAKWVYGDVILNIAIERAEKIAEEVGKVFVVLGFTFFQF